LMGEGGDVTSHPSDQQTPNSPGQIGHLSKSSK
jgi:hypothetical protein